MCAKKNNANTTRNKHYADFPNVVAERHILRVRT